MGRERERERRGRTERWGGRERVKEKEIWGKRGGEGEKKGRERRL